MNTRILLLLITIIPLLHGQTSKDLLRDGLFAEESEGDLKTATEKYEALLKAFEAERKVAAVALFRLAAVKRKQGEDTAALALYEEFGRKFGNIEPQATLVRENYLAISGKEFPNSAGGSSEGDEELARIKKLEISSPDLFPNLDGFNDFVTAGKSRIVAYLLEKGADPNYQGAIESAVKTGNMAMVKQLLEAGADPNHESNFHAFGFAIEEGHWQIAELLGKHKANINRSWPGVLSEEEIMNLPPPRIVFLLAHGADPNHIQKDWARDGTKTIGIPLLDAVRLEKHDYAKLLLKSGAKVDLARPNDGVRALHLACSKGDEKMIKILIEAGADLNAPTGSLTQSDDPLLKNEAYPKRYNRIKIWEARAPIDLLSIEKVSILIEAGAKLSTDLLVRALETNKTDFLDYLISKGADINQKSETPEGGSLIPVDIAFATGNEKMAQHLLARGARLSDVDWGNFPPNYRVKAARERRYLELAKTGKIHIVFPEASGIESATFEVESDSNIISNLLETSLPNLVSNSNEERLIDFDALTWSLVRGEKVEQIDFEKSLPPQFAPGDIIEITGFAEYSNNLYFNTDRSNEATLKYLAPKFSTQLRRAARFPIKVTYAGATHDMIICPDKLTFDARSNEIPAGNLGEVLELLLTNSQSLSSYDFVLHIGVERTNFPKFNFRTDKPGLSGFELEPGDHLSISDGDFGDPFGDSEPKPQTREQWEDNLRSRGVSAQVPGKPGGWHWIVPPHLQGESGVAPTLLAIIADINAGYQHQNHSVGKFAFDLLTYKNFLKVLPGIDLSRIVIRRYAQKQEGEKEIVLNLSEKIAQWVAAEKKTPPFDVQLQVGDIVEVTAKEGEWQGFSRETNQYFEAALNFPLIMTRSRSTDSFALNFEMPNWHELDWGFFPYAEEGTRSSIRGDLFLSSPASLQRGGNDFNLSNRSTYWPKAGDIITEQGNPNARRASVAPPLPRPGPSSRKVQVQKWPPAKGEDEKAKDTSHPVNRSRYVPRPK